MAEREVEVNFVEADLPGFWWPVAVRSCMMLDLPTEVTRRRDCLDRYVRVKRPMTPLFEHTVDEPDR